MSEMATKAMPTADPPPPACECGCGQQVKTAGARFRLGHYLKSPGAAETVSADGWKAIRTIGAEAVWRKASLTKLRTGRGRATPIGKIIIDRLLDSGMLVKEFAGELSQQHGGRRGVGLGLVERLIWKRGTWPIPGTRRALAESLGLSTDEIEALLREGGARLRRRSRMVTFACEYVPCGHPATQPRSAYRRCRRHYCSPQCSLNARTGKRRPTSRPKSGRRSGRNFAKAVAVSKMPADQAIADIVGVSFSGIFGPRHRGSAQGPFVTYCLQQNGLPLRRHLWTGLGQEIVAWCYEKGGPTVAGTRQAAVRLQQSSGITWLAFLRVIRNGRTSSQMLKRLAVEMGEDFGWLTSLRSPGAFDAPTPYAGAIFRAQVNGGGTPDREAIVARVTERCPGADPDAIRRYVDGLSRKRRGPGAPPGPRSYTDNEAREALRLRHEQGLGYGEIGVRMGWPIKRKRDGRLSGSPKAKRACKYALSLPSGK